MGPVSQTVHYLCSIEWGQAWNQTSALFPPASAHASTHGHCVLLCPSCGPHVKKVLNPSPLSKFCSGGTDLKDQSQGFCLEHLLMACSHVLKPVDRAPPCYMTSGPEGNTLETAQGTLLALQEMHTGSKDAIREPTRRKRAASFLHLIPVWTLLKVLCWTLGPDRWQGDRHVLTEATVMWGSDTGQMVTQSNYSSDGRWLLWKRTGCQGHWVGGRVEPVR